MCARAIPPGTGEQMDQKPKLQVSPITELQIALYIANELRLAATIHDANAHAARVNRQHTLAGFYNEQATTARDLANKIDAQQITVAKVAQSGAQQLDDEEDDMPNGCAECARSFGPHYRGKCTH